MEPKVGDRVSLDAKKVGQPRRSGVVRVVSKGLSGVRLEVEWVDGTRSIIAPGAGTLQIEGRSTAQASAKAKAGAKPKTKRRG